MLGSVWSVEIGDQRHLRARRGVQRVHVLHVVHAIDLLLDGRGDCLLQGQCVGADIVGLQRISGGTMLGNCATGRLVIVTPPTITIRIAITIATIGRLMKNFDIAQFPSPESCAGLAVTRVPSLSFASPSTTTCSPGLRPSSINPHRPELFRLASRHAY